MRCPMLCNTKLVRTFNEAPNGPEQTKGRRKMLLLLPKRKCSYIKALHYLKKKKKKMELYSAVQLDAMNCARDVMKIIDTSLIDVLRSNPI